MNKFFQEIIESIDPIDIREVVGVKADNKSDVLKESHYLISAVDHLKVKTNNLGYDFCTKNGFIYFFNGQFWQQIIDGELRHLLRTVSDNMGIDKYKAHYYRFIESLTKQFFAGVSIMRENKQDAIVINLQNGTYEFGEDCHLREFRKDDFLNYQLPFGYKADSKAPLFEAYLNRVLPDVECQNILAEFIGYVFTNGHKQQKCMLLYGNGANGKSVFFEIVKALLGWENVTSFSLRNLGEENCRAMISNKLLNYSSEIDANINNETFKQLCSGEPLQARLKYKDSFIMDKYAKLIFNCNELPKNVEFTNAYFRRILIIPFTQTIPEAEQDKDLARKIIANELSGIFNWVLMGLDRLTKYDKFSESGFVDKALEEFKQESDSVHQFIDAFGYEKVVECKTRFMPLYKDYAQYCQENGFRALNSRNFRKRLEAQNVTITRLANGNCVCLARGEGNVIFEEEMPF
ncbi:MAG: phage/plasmid primase, P4 family [Bacteroidota bacterium]